MKIFNASLLFCFLVTVLLSCDQVKHNKVNDKNDSFNSSTGGFDRPRIPLIKPYELLKVSETEWRMKLQTPNLLTLSIHNVQGINVISNRILFIPKVAQSS